MTALLQVLRYAGISGSDLISYAGSAGMFLLLALVACLLPARR
jgi:hypothetical protein